MPIERKPEIIVFAGPNGSGKSTVTQLVDIVRPYINADDIKREQSCSDLEAAQYADALREEMLAAKSDFTFETVLSTDAKLDFLRKAKAHGYFVKGFFVLTADPRVNVIRIEARVATGGHDVPTEKIVSRYEKSLRRVPQFVALCDVCHIYDNTTQETVRIFKKTKSAEYRVWPSAFWTAEQIQELVGIPGGDI